MHILMYINYHILLRVGLVMGMEIKIKMYTHYNIYIGREILFFVCLFLKHISKMYVCICIIHASFLHNDMCMWCFYFFSSNKMVSYHTKMYFISQFTTLILSILQKKYVISPSKIQKYTI